MSGSTELYNINTKLNELITISSSYKEDNIRLMSVIRAERVINQQLREKIMAVERQLTVTLLSKSVSEVSSTPRIAYARINNMIKQIDRCISLLNK